MTISESGPSQLYLGDIPNLCKATLSAIADGVVITDVNGIIIWANYAYEQSTGYSLDELMNKSTSILRANKQSAEFYDKLWSTILAGDIWIGEIWNKRKDGILYLEEQSITLVKDETSCISHFVAINRDITLKKKINEQLYNAKRIEAIGQLTAGVAHNFNNKLASILGFADLVLDEIQQYKNNELEESITEIITAGKFARDLVKQMMAFSVTTFSEPKPVDLHLAINQAVKIISSTFPAEVRIVTKLDEVPLVLLDPVRLHQMLISLAVNANEAMQKHGELTFSVAMNSFEKMNCNSCHDVISGKYIYISVRDSGKGISLNNIDNIFMPFFTTRQHEGGTGMGLSALHGMLHDMEGHVIVDTTVGEFTEFKLLFPVSVVAEKVLPEAKTSNIKYSKALKDFHILIVDDDVSVANFMSEILSVKGYQVTKETNSTEAFKTFSDNPDKYDLLITDQSMPELSGTELVKRIYAIRQDLPIFLMTGYGETELSSASEHIHTILTKPFDTSILLEKISQL